MNTGFLGPAVATVLTVYGIETAIEFSFEISFSFRLLQQYLPFTVLKPITSEFFNHILLLLQQYLPFTVLKQKLITIEQSVLVATVLTVYGIETEADTRSFVSNRVATVLTVYGIETGFIVLPTSHHIDCLRCNSTYRLRY